MPTGIEVRHLWHHFNYIETFTAGNTKPVNQAIFTYRYDTGKGLKPNQRRPSFGIQLFAAILRSDDRHAPGSTHSNTGGNLAIPAS